MIDRVRRELTRRRKTLAALGVAALSRRASEEVWLFGGAVGAAYGDNSAALHRYVIEHHPEIRAVWLINRDSPDVARARAVGPVAFREELSTYVLALQADVHVVSHGLHDIPTCASRLSRAFKVRLGHGVTALKKTKPPPLRDLKRAFRTFDLVPVSSEFERKIKRLWSIPDERIAVTGVPRFDDLERKAARKGPSTLFYMPTWREWLPQSAEEIRGSSFMQHVSSFLLHPGLHRLLEDADLVLEVYIHRLMHGAVSDLIAELPAGDRVRLLPARVDVQDHLASARALITDYSGVAWDMLFLRRPVVFYSFDLEEYEAARGGYIDLRNDLPGVRCTSANSLVSELERVVRSDFALSPEAASWLPRMFPWHDARNCERVFQEIQRRREIPGFGREPGVDVPPTRA